MKRIDDENISPEEWANEIISLRDNSDGMYDFLPDKYDLALHYNKEKFSREILRISNEMKNAKYPNQKSLADILTCVSKYIKDIAKYSDDKEMLITSLRFYQIAKESFRISHGKDFDAYLNGEKIGLFVTALTFSGSSANQAKKSTAEWLKLSQTKVESHYLQIYKNYRSLEGLFGSHGIEVAQMLIEYKDNKFPQGKGTVKYTYNAFMNLKKSLAEYLNTDDQEIGLSIKPFHLRINWDQVEEIRKQLLSL
jgi:DNA polymerase III epsilon subunit-like protein